jgi:hypothetical protein
LDAEVRNWRHEEVRYTPGKGESAECGGGEHGQHGDYPPPQFFQVFRPFRPPYQRCRSSAFTARRLPAVQGLTDTLKGGLEFPYCFSGCPAHLGQPLCPEKYQGKHDQKRDFSHSQMHTDTSSPFGNSVLMLSYTASI